MPVLSIERQELYAQARVRGLEPKQAAEKAGFPPSSVYSQYYRLERNEKVIARIAELRDEICKVSEQILQGAEQLCKTPVPFIAQAVRQRHYRLTVIQDVVDRIRQLIDERAAAGVMQEDVPGAGTGLLVRKQRNLKRGKKIEIVEEWQFDGAVLSELRDSLVHAAKEVGDWEEKHRVNDDRSVIDLTALTTEQLLEEQRILAEARQRLEALRTPREPGLIEAAPGSCAEVEVPDEVGTVDGRLSEDAV